MRGTVGTAKFFWDLKKEKDSVKGSVIQASEMALFEDALKAGTLVVDIWSSVSVQNTPGGQFGTLGEVSS